MSDTDAQARSIALIERLNVWWKIGGPDRHARSLQHRLAYPIWWLFEKFLGPQETFNSLLVQYVNTSLRPLELALEHHRAALDSELNEIRYLHDDVRRFHEALAARERRMDTAMGAMRAEHDEMRTSLGVLRHANQSLTRRVEHASGAALDAPPLERTGSAPAAPSSSDALTDAYVGFEDAFRGSPEAIRAGLAEYVPFFAGTSDVLDVGCGRGEFLALLAEQGVSASGIDLNEAMVGVCAEKGLRASRADALGYLRAQAPGSLGGLFAAQVVEHLEPAYLTQFLSAASDALRPGAPIVLETINPACWFAFFESYVRDITHVRPIHPETLKFLLVASGFERVDIRYRAPYPEHEKLQPVPKTSLPGDVAETLNANVEKVNRLLFTYLDYAAIGKRA